MILCGLVTPLIGTLIDRWGCRKVLLPGIPLFSLTVAAFALIQASFASIYLLFGLAGIFGAAQNTVPYVAVVSRWFGRDRGLALGIATSGFGLGVVIVPQLANIMIHIAGWRMAYIGLGATIMIFAFVPVLLFVFEPEDACLAGNGHESADVNREGLAAAEVFSSSWRFWVMCAGFFVAIASTNGTLTNLIAMLTDRGTGTMAAATALSIAGVGAIVGRLSCGWCLDRFHGPNVAVCFFLIPSAGIALLLSGDAGPIPSAGAFLCGAGTGAITAMMAFFASRYFGLRAYGTIFGTMFGAFLVGSGIGPFLHGLSFDLLHSYRPALIGSCAALLFVAGMFAPFGPYPFAGQSRRLASPPETQRGPSCRHRSAAIAMTWNRMRDRAIGR
jgi:MFS family permease